MPIRKKNHAPKTHYTSPKQLTLEGFETPFEKQLKASNRWVVLSAELLPDKQIKNIPLECT